MKSVRKALTIAGSDSGAGAGIQADLKTFAALGVYGASVITAITAQNTKGVTDVHVIPTGTVAAQLDAVQGEGRVALMIWGDPSLYDSSLRIARRLQARYDLRVQVFPGIASPQVLAAAHGITLNRLGSPFLVTTGRRLRQHGWRSVERTTVRLTNALGRGVAPVRPGVFVHDPMNVFEGGD
jgi:precorrin-2 methylase